jgi:ABC-2 type transport system ATP-binding protein
LEIAYRLIQKLTPDTLQILKTERLTKKYRRITALHQLDLEINNGMVFGLLGPNGSGKTTTLGLLLGVLQATSGTFTWFGEQPTADSRKRIGAILETPCFYPYMTAVQNLAIVSTIKKCPDRLMYGVLKMVGLYDRRNDPFRTYSLGMKQRLAIASALLANPEVLILDEPTNGLDPQGIVEIRRLVQEIAAIGKTIILASHLLDEVQKVCTDFCVLRKGEKLFQGNVREALADHVTIDLAAEDLENLRRTMESFHGVTALESHSKHINIRVENGITTETINRYLMDKNIVLSLLAEKPGSLEQQFLNILAEND